MFWSLIFYTLKGYLRKPSDWLAVIAAYALSVMLYGYALSHQSALLNEISHYIIWINLLLVSFLAIPTLFGDEREEGGLEQWVLMPVSLEYILSIKLIIHCFFALMPSVVLAPLMLFMLAHEAQDASSLMVALALGALIIASLNLLIGALLTSEGQKPAIIQLLLLPIYVPVLLFGIHASAQPIDFSMNSGIIPLIAICLIILPFSILTSAMILRKNAGFS